MFLAKCSGVVVLLCCFVVLCVVCCVFLCCCVLCCCCVVLLLCCCCCYCVVCVWWVCSGPLRRTPPCAGPPRAPDPPVRRTPPCAGPPLRRTPLRRTPLRRTALRRTALRRTAQNFALFFPSPATVFILFSLSCWSFRGILVVFLKTGTLKCARLGSRAVVCKPRRPHQTGRRGSHTTARELQTCTFKRPGASNTTKIPRKRPKEMEKRMKTVAGERKKKREILGPHRSGPPPFGAPPFGAPLFPGSGPPPFGAPPFGAPPFGAPNFWAPLFLGLGPPTHGGGSTLRGAKH